MKKSLLTVLILSANLFINGCADDQARQQIADTNQKLSQLQKNVGVLDNKVTNQKMLDILNQLSDLQSQINQLNGSVANNANTQKQFQELQQQLNQSLDLRIQALETGKIPTNINSSAPISSSAPIAISSRAALQQAVNKIKASDFNGAIKALKDISKTTTDKQVLADSQYYLAIAYAANTKYSDSIAIARKFLKANPTNKNVPDALRTIYIDQVQMGDKIAAENTAKKLVKSFPNSTAAKKVSQQIQ